MLCDVCCMAGRCAQLLSKKWIYSRRGSVFCSVVWRGLVKVVWCCVVWGVAMLCKVCWMAGRCVLSKKWVDSPAWLSVV